MEQGAALQNERSPCEACAGLPAITARLRRYGYTIEDSGECGQMLEQAPMTPGPVVV